MGDIYFLPLPMLKFEAKEKKGITEEEIKKAQAIDNEIIEQRKKMQDTCEYPRGYYFDIFGKNIYNEDKNEYTSLYLGKRSYLFRKDILKLAEGYSTEGKFKSYLNEKVLNVTAKKIVKAVQKSLVLRIEIEADASTLVREVLKYAILPLRQNDSFKHLGIASQVIICKKIEKKIKHKKTANRAKIRDKNEKEVIPGETASQTNILKKIEKIIVPDLIVIDDKTDKKLLTIEVKCKDISFKAMEQHVDQLENIMAASPSPKCVYGILTNYKRWIFTVLDIGRKGVHFVSAYEIEDKYESNPEDMFKKLVKFIRTLIFKAYEPSK